MGLFTKKEKVNIVLVGKINNRAISDPSNISLLRRSILPQIVREKIGEDAEKNNRVAVILFDEWTNQCYSANALAELSKNGFSISNSSELESMYNEINQALLLYLNCSMDTLRPAVFSFPVDDIYAGLFVICFENKVKSKYLDK